MRGRRGLPRPDGGLPRPDFSNGRAPARLARMDRNSRALMLAATRIVCRSSRLRLVLGLALTCCLAVAPDLAAAALAGDSLELECYARGWDPLPNPSRPPAQLPTPRAPA